MKKIFTALFVAICVSAHGQKFDQLAQTPPMGWNSWNKFAGNVSEQLIRETADAMATNGMKDAGYVYVNIDDCWHGQRDAQGFIQPDPTRFPSGIKALADYVHSKGLKLGIYSDCGAKTCGGRPGGRGHEYQDALTYAQWGIDYLKYDWCNAQDLKAEGAYTTMRDAIYAAGRPMVFSLCEWGDNQPWLWAKDVGHLWRTTGDIYPIFDGKIDHNHGQWFSWGVLQILDKQEGLRVYAGPGHWNDPDMLEVGNGMKVNEDRAHFSMWCMLAAPLISGNDQRNMSQETLSILTAKDVIALDQDTLGIEAFKYGSKEGVEFWFKPLVNGDWAMCVLNRNTNSAKVAFDWKAEAVSDSFSKRDAHFDTTVYSLRNLWTQADAGTTGTMLDTEVPAHDVLLLRLVAPGNQGAAMQAATNAAASAPTTTNSPMTDASKGIYIKAGASSPFMDSTGHLWLADAQFADGDTISRDDTQEISNTKTPELYRSERYGMTAFTYPLPNGKYTVKLHFAETYDGVTAAGERVFSFNVQGQEFKDFDVFVKAGGANRAYIETVPVEITNGKLSITFESKAQNPEINAIEILPDL